MMLADCIFKLSLCLLNIIKKMKNEHILDIPYKKTSQNLPILDLSSPYFGQQSGNDLRVTNYHAEYKREDQLRLIQRSINTSFLAMVKPKKKSKQLQQQHSQNNLIKSKIMERTRLIHSVIKAPSHILEDQQIAQSFSCKLEVKSHTKQRISLFNCCNATESAKLYQCFLTQIEENSIRIKLPISEKPDFILNFNTVDATIEKAPKKAQQTIIRNQQYRLKVGNSFALQFGNSAQSTQKDLSKWAKLLQKRIEGSVGKRFHIKDLQRLQNGEFYKQNYKLEREFVSQCQTGDILLFQSNHFMAKAQRLATGSDFDHVGVIIRDPVYDILLYESNGNTGVCLTPWKLIIKKKWYQNVAKMVWRKLEGIKRQYQFIQEFHGFVMANMKRKYHISFDKLTLKTSFVPQNKEEQGYFCSQLVARVYKKLELIPTAQGQQNYRPACSFLPYNFTEKAGLKLLKGYLSVQYQIVFNEDVIAQDYLEQ